MAKITTDDEGNTSILSECERLRADHFKSTNTWQIDSELEDVDPASLFDWAGAIAEFKLI